MARINDNYLKLPGSYLFSEIARRVAAYKEKNPKGFMHGMDHLINSVKEYKNQFSGGNMLNISKTIQKQS